MIALASWANPTLAPAQTPAAEFSAYNDIASGPGTHANTTLYAPNATGSGFMKDIDTGADTAVTLTVTASGVNYETNTGVPASGTDADAIFGGFVDFSTAHPHSLALSGTDEFMVQSSQYTGPPPGVGTGTASGSKGYGLSGIRLKLTDSFTVRQPTIANNSATEIASSRARVGGEVTDIGADIPVVTLYWGAKDAGRNAAERFLDTQGSELGSDLVGDNLSFVLEPNSEEPDLSLSFSADGNSLLVEFGALDDWLYSLERSEDLLTWIEIVASTAGTGGRLIFTDPDPPTDAAFYRVGCRRP